MAINILQKGGNRICHIPPTPKVVGFLWWITVTNVMKTEGYIIQHLWGERHMNLVIEEWFEESFLNKEVYDSSMKFEDINRYKQLFATKEDCQKYCDWLKESKSK